MATVRRLLVFSIIVALLAGCSGRGGLDRSPPTAGTATAPVATAPATSERGDSGTPEPAALTSQPELPFEAFLESSFAELLQRDPEWVTADGLAERLGMGQDQLTDLSDTYQQETQRLQVDILERLREYDREALSPGQQISYDVYEWFLDDLVRGQAFAYHDYPINHLVTGIQNQLIYFFTDIHPVASRQDAEDYVARLWQVDDKFEGLIEGLALREEAGVVLPEYLFPWVMGDIRSLAHAPPQGTPFYTAFRDKVNTLADLNAGEKEALLAAAEEAIAGSVVPAFATLEREMDRLERAAPGAGGAWRLPEGVAYYEYALRHHTTTDMTAEEIHELGLRELDRIHGQMRARFAELGYPAEASLPELYKRLARESGTIRGAEVTRTYEEIIEGAEARLDEAFDLRPQADVIVIAGDVGDFYVSASLDGSRPGAFYARTSGGKALYEMPTLAYHETVPGHHFQIAIAQEVDLPLCRNTIGFTGYAEGWALYAEELAAELGWYEGDPAGDLGRLRDQAFRAARLVVDTGLHAKKWSFQQAHQFMVENVGSDPGFLEFEVSRYIAWPGQATAYMVGMLKIKELRQWAQEQLGERFDLKEFHHVVLSNGSMPLEVLERVVEGYVAAESAEAAPALPDEAGTEGLSPDEVASLSSLRQVDGYPLYTMHYYGDYLLEAEGRRGWERAAGDRQWACSLFAALPAPGASAGGPAEEQLLGRNFDWEYSPALLLFTEPKAGYASVTMVDIAYLGFAGGEARAVLDLPLRERQALLQAPYIPFDGMNEMGLAVGMAAVPSGGMGRDPSKTTVGSLEVIRLILDRAGTVDEALAILGAYNVDMTGGPPLHYLIADRTGRSALVEFYEGEMVVLPNGGPWQAATNFLRAAAGEAAKGLCWRYDRLEAALAEEGGRLGPGEALSLLEEVAQESTQWSVVYELSRGEVTVALGRGYDRTHTFRLGGGE